MKGKNRPVLCVPALAAVILALAACAFVLEKPVSQNSKAQSIIDRVWSHRAQDHDAAALDEEIGELETALDLDRNNHGLLVALSSYCFDRGMSEPEEDSETGRERARRYFEKGYDYARRALAVKETSLGHYLAAINKGAAVAREGIYSQVTGFREVKSHIDWIGEHDRDFHYGAYARFWLDCYLHGPDPVIALVGVDKEDACREVAKQIKREPRYLENYYYQLTACTDPADELAQLNVMDTALTVDPDSLPGEEDVNHYYHEKLEKMWKEKTGKDHQPPCPDSSPSRDKER